jgi:hypothetical protein
VSLCKSLCKCMSLLTAQCSLLVTWCVTPRGMHTARRTFDQLVLQLQSRDNVSLPVYLDLFAIVSVWGECEYAQRARWWRHHLDLEKAGLLCLAVRLPTPVAPEGGSLRIPRR